ncbi:redoxin domain-containing protein [Desulfofundulus thermobenzoicus]|uniref:redoxin domain-containing protein n=1 Tax=Desulfofundulus thermobenzoicus TaxID=29376 RepID=UPI00311AB0EF
MRWLCVQCHGYKVPVTPAISPSIKPISSMIVSLLSDRTQEISWTYEVLDEETGAAYRATFIISPQSRIEYYCVYPREVGRNVDEIIRVLQAVQFAAATGEGVPAGWHPGQPGIKIEFDQAGTI